MGRKSFATRLAALGRARDGRFVAAQCDGCDAGPVSIRKRRRTQGEANEQRDRAKVRGSGMAAREWNAP